MQVQQVIDKANQNQDNSIHKKECVHTLKQNSKKPNQYFCS